MRSLDCKFTVRAEYSKSPTKRSISTAGEAAMEAAKPKEPSADTVQIIAHASLDPELFVSWASEAGDFNFGVRSTLVSVCEGTQLRDADTDEWTDSISGADRIFCTTVVTFSHAEPLARKFSAIFNLEATLDPAAGCLKFCGVTPTNSAGWTHPNKSIFRLRSKCSHSHTLGQKGCSILAWKKKGRQLHKIISALRERSDSSARAPLFQRLRQVMK